MLLCQTPDPKLTRDKLERVVRDLRATALPVGSWHFREVYVDRGQQDPYYLMDWKPVGGDAGDFVFDQPLLACRAPALKAITLTHDRQGAQRPAWETLTGIEVAGRLDRFMALYRDDKLQPPGTKQGWTTSSSLHATFERRRFLFHLRSHTTAVAGVGPSCFVGGEASLCGQVRDATGSPAGGVVVELVCPGGVLRRTTQADGHFWFSRVPPGLHKLRLPNRQLHARILDRLPYGLVTGTARTSGGVVLTGQRIELTAPDGELFQSSTNAEGKFSAGPLPPFTYRLRVPPFLFSAQVSYISGGEITGNLVNEEGRPLSGLTVVLKQGGIELARRTTAADGRFSFQGLAAGRFSLGVPDCTLYLRSASGAAVQGRLGGAGANQLLELVARGAVVARQTTDAAGRFHFDNLPAGNYALRAPGRELARKGAS
ncbi:MAG TPA: carboxypeptidase-like regulatory domain-containing protein [Kofleriaceae bacterium]|nr:carboxypeptidase-like regulatory domain-containing protein [Kofleriaceae bacterium]